MIGPICSGISKVLIPIWGSQKNPHVLGFPGALHLQSMNTSSPMGRGSLALHLFFQIYGVILKPILKPKLLNPEAKNLVFLLLAVSFFPEAIKPHYLPGSWRMKRKNIVDISACDPQCSLLYWLPQAQCPGYAVPLGPTKVF